VGGEVVLDVVLPLSPVHGLEEAKVIRGGVEMLWFEFFVELKYKIRNAFL